MPGQSSITQETPSTPGFLVSLTNVLKPLQTNENLVCFFFSGMAIQNALWLNETKVHQMSSPKAKAAVYNRGRSKTKAERGKIKVIWILHWTANDSTMPGIESLRLCPFRRLDGEALFQICSYFLILFPFGFFSSPSLNSSISIFTCFIYRPPFRLFFPIPIFSFSLFLSPGIF